MTPLELTPPPLSIFHRPAYLTPSSFSLAIPHHEKRRPRAKSIMAHSRGEKGPAPVLPATGLHSYHNDSPPFMAATADILDQPDMLNINTPRQGPTTMNNSFHTGGGVQGLAGGDPSQLPPSITNSISPNGGSSPLPPTHHAFSGPGIPVGRNSPPIDAMRQAYITTSSQLAQGQPRIPSPSGLGQITSPTRLSNPPIVSPSEEFSLDQKQQQNQTSGSSAAIQIPNPGESSTSRSRNHQRVPTSSDDVSLSSSRSKSLRSGYFFGSPQPTPTGGVGSKDELLPHPSSSDPSPTQSTFTEYAIDKTPYDNDAALYGFADGEADLDTTAIQAVDKGASISFMKGEGEYRFPAHRLKRRMRDETKIPLIIVACGSFSPPTYLHLRMFEMAKDEIVESQTYEIMAGYYSPVSSYYKKSGLAPAEHRVRMCELAVEHTSTWLMVDPWEAGQPEYQRTAIVLDHFDEMLNGKDKDGEGGVEMKDGGRRKYKIMLLAGGDLIESFGEPGVWSEPDLHIILGRFGCLIVERAGSDVWAFLLSHDILYHHRKNVVVIKQLIYNDISSTKVRLFVRRGMSIKYLLPNSVANYIAAHKLYLEPERSTAKIS